MKLLKFALIVPILIGCGSKNNSIEVLKKNAKSYTQVANTTAYRGKDAILYFNIKNNRLKINLIDKREVGVVDDLTITECKIDKTTYIPIEDNSINQIGKHYYIDLTTNNKVLNIECKLNNNEIVKKTLKRYWK